MAKCEKQEVVSVTLELTDSEANALRDIVGAVTGHNDTSRRRFANAIYAALCDAGVKGEGYADLAGTLEFMDQK
jgi:AMMECR1 domain-containing protein